MMKIRELIWISAGVLTLVSCSNGFCKKGNGNMDIREESFTSFQHVELDGIGDLTLVPVKSDGQYKLITEADENIMGRLEAKMNGSTLMLNTKKCIKKGDISYRLEVPIDLLSVSIDGAGDVRNLDTLRGDAFEAEIQGAGDMDLTLVSKKLKLTIDGAGDIRSFINTGFLEAQIDGAGDIKLEGNANTAEGNINGAGNIEAPQLKVEHWIVNIDGSGNAELSVSKSLAVFINGSGNVVYSGQPATVTSDIDGSGDLTKR